MSDTNLAEINVKLHNLERLVYLIALSLEAARLIPVATTRYCERCDNLFEIVATLNPLKIEAPGLPKEQQP